MCTVGTEIDRWQSNSVWPGKMVTVVSSVTVWQLHSAQGTGMTESDYQWVLKDGFW